VDAFHSFQKGKLFEQVISDEKTEFRSGKLTRTGRNDVHTETFSNNLKILDKNFCTGEGL
jgi:hypothetical protein